MDVEQEKRAEVNRVATDSEPKHVLRVVVSSPGDVQAERNAIVPMVARLNRMFEEMEMPVLLMARRWEEYALPGLHQESPQALVDDALAIPDCHVLVALFRNRLGTPVHDADSGTVHEIRSAVREWKKKGSPRVMLYFGEPISSGGAADDEQLRKVREFKNEMRATENALTSDYLDPPDFVNKLQEHLFKFAVQWGKERTRHAGSAVSSLRVSWKPELGRIRSEGYTELLGPWFLYCTFEGDAPPEQTLHFGIAVYLDTAVTSRNAEPVLLEVGRPGANPMLPCTSINGSVVIFHSIALEGIMPRETRIFQISNIRCNATFLPAIKAAVVVTGASIDKDTQEVARVSAGLGFEVLDANGRIPVEPATFRQAEPLVPTRVAILRYSEGFSGAFKSIVASPVSRTLGGRLVYNGESSPIGYLIQLHEGGLAFTGASNAGTRLQAAFNNLPIGVRLSVGIYGVSDRPGLVARLVEPESPAPITSPQIGGAEVRALRIENGFASACWEVKSTGSHLSGAAFLDFAVFAAYDALPARNLPPPGTCTVNGSFAPSPPEFPASAGSASSPHLPIPRFVADTRAARPLLRIIL